MSWSFSPELVEEFSQACCSDTERSAPSNTAPTPDQFYWPDKPTEHSLLSRFGTTCEPLTGDRGEALLTWFRGAFPAKKSAQPAAAVDWKERAPASGEKWPESFAKWSPATCEWKTAQFSLLGDLAPFLATWPRSGLMRDGMCWELPTLAPVIGESEFGYAPTVLTSEATGPCLHGNGSHNFRTWFRANSTEKRSPLHGELMMLWPEGWATVGAPLETVKFQQWLQQHGVCLEAPDGLSG